MLLDEDAFNRLKDYLDRLRAYFQQSGGSGEIMEDIEARIAEMLQERLKGKQIASLTDVEAIITIMGTPEDFDPPETGETSFDQAGKSGSDYTGKSLYRDSDNRILGGVCAGIAAYFGMDPIWLRLAFILVLFFFGSGILVYIILWIILPKARTRAEKLRMHGRPVNIHGLQESWKEEAEGVREKFNEYKETARNFAGSGRVEQARSRFETFLHELGDILRRFIPVLVKIIGAVLIAFGILILIFLMLALLGSGAALGVSLPFLGRFLFISAWQTMVCAAAAVMIVGIPIMALIGWGLAALFRVRMPNKLLVPVLALLWLAGWGLAVYLAAIVGNDFSKKGYERNVMPLGLGQDDTVIVEMMRRPNGFEWSYETDFSGMREWVLDEDSLILRDIELRVERTDQGEAELVTYLTARAATRTHARQRASGIQYTVEQSRNRLILADHYAILGQPWRHQTVRLLLKVPRGMTLILDPSAEAIIESEEDGGVIRHRTRTVHMADGGTRDLRHRTHHHHRNRMALMSF